MKIAALSDIHSNIYALEAVIAHLKLQGCDEIVNLGDILYGPIAPKATFERLMEENFITIRGNQDRQIYEADEQEIAANPTLQFILEELDSNALEWLQRLPADKQINDDIYLCHGTPESDLVYLLEDIRNGDAAVRKDQEIIELLAGQVSPLILCGHTHIPRTVKTSTEQLIVNPGSVGLPAYCDELPNQHRMENYSYHASYALIEGEGNHWTIQHIKVDYPYEKAAKAAEKHQRQDWAHALCFGRIKE